MRPGRGIHAWRGSTAVSGGTSPSVEGLPRQGRGEAGEGRGPNVAQQRLGRSVRNARRVPSQINKKGLLSGSTPAGRRTWADAVPSVIHAWRGSTAVSGGTSPSVEGLPRQGRGEAGEGRGPNVAQQRLGRSARSALRVPSQINKKGRPKGSLFYLSGGERGIRTPEARFRRLHTFQACSFNHSDTSPDPCHRQTPQQGRRF